MSDVRVNDLDQELFSELTESLVQPLLVHVVAPFVNGNDPNYCVQINGKVLWEWRIMDGSLKKLFAVLQSNLRANGYQLEESVFDRPDEMRRMTRMHLSQSLVILISLTTPNNTWISAAFPYIKVRRKAARIWKKNHLPNQHP